jgi:apolipoprotein N-acyltransferase
MNKLPRPLLNYLLAVLSAVWLVLTFPDWNVVWFAPFALAPLLFALASEPRPGHRFLLGYVTGNIYWFGVCNWIQFVLEVHGGMGRWGGWGSFLLFSLIKSLHMALFAMLAAVLLPHWYAIPAIAALWTGIERTHGTFGFAWLCLGNAGIDMALPLRLAPLVGVYGLSFLFAMMSVATVVVLEKRGRKQLLWLAVIPGLFLLPSMPAKQDGSETAVLVQPNVPEEADWTPLLIEQMHQDLLRQSFEWAMRTNAHLIVWPEVPGPIYYDQDPRLRGQIAQVARLTKSDLVVGTVAFTPQRAPLNSAMVIRPDGTVVDRYDKINLVPFGEFVPPFFSFVNRISPEAGDFVPGTRIVVFPLDGHKLGTFICYESVFPEEVRQFVKNGAELLVNISNDGYFGHSGAREQHLEIVRMRAAENRRWLLRDTNDGVTAAIDPGGHVTKRLPMYQDVSGDFRYSYETGTTPYTRYGDWFAWGCLIASAVALCVSQRPHYTPPSRKRKPMV